MAEFITPLIAELVDDIKAEGRGRWRLVSPLAYRSDRLGRVIAVPAGFETDYASVPRAPVAFWLTGDTAHRAAVLHDYLYATRETDRATADALLYEAALATSVPIWRAKIMWSAVRAFGGGHWKG